MEKKKKKNRMKEVTEKIKQRSKVTTWTYFIIRILVIWCLVRNVMQGYYENVFTCILTLILLIMPFVMERQLKIDIPGPLEVIILVFIFSAEILGEINAFYIKFPHWDTILHTLNGFVMAAVGLSLIDLLNKSEEVQIKLSPSFVAISAFCFSMTIGVFWEFFEFSCDKYLNLDTQKDTIVESINSVVFDETNSNEVKHIDIESLEVNGEDWIEEYGGYIDIGLIDTIYDLVVNAIGAFTFSIFGYFYVKNQDEKSVVKKLLIIPSKE